MNGSHGTTGTPRTTGTIATIVTGMPGVGGLAELAAVMACRRQEWAGPGSTAIVIELDRSRPRVATVVATSAAKDLEQRLRGAGTLPDDVSVSARGRIVFASIGPARTGSGDGRDQSERRDRVGQPDAEESGSLEALLDLLPEDLPRVVLVPAGCFREVLELEGVVWDEVLIRSDSTDEPEATDTDPDGATDPLVTLAAEEAREHAGRVEIVTRTPGWLRGRIALAGRSTVGSRTGEEGQATPLVLGGVFVLVLGAVALVALGGAITGKARGQRTADLSALSAARSMKDDLPRLMAPSHLPNGAPNPYHMPKPIYLSRARFAAVRVAATNGASPLGVSVRFPDRASWAPVRARVAVGVVVKHGKRGAAHRAPSVWAEARVAAPVTMGSVPAVASGGGYSGPLAERQGKGMRPDVAVAFDAMAAAAGAAGVVLAINSAFRSDAEQAVLFAANPNPTMVARPGTSLHRCGTELDLGPPSAYGWLAANAGRFGFIQRYAWESWHFGYTSGPAPCSGAGDRVAVGGPGRSREGGASAGGGGTGHGARGGGGRGDRSQALPNSLPSFVPARYRKAILRSAMKWNVSAALLAAQLYAESGFDPGVVSSAGAMGIAQFMSGTAATYGLRDPFDPDAAIDAQGHLMSDLLKQFGSPALALAAYNAGPGAVSPCNCIPPYAETQAYVAKILAMLGGAGAIAPMPMEIELVK